MRICFLCFLFSYFAFHAVFVRSEYGIVSSTKVSYLWMEFPSVSETIFPRRLSVNLSITTYAGAFLYSIDANGNQLIVTMSGRDLILLVEVMGGQESKINLRQLCGCKLCLYIPLLLEIGIENSTIWTRCNKREMSMISFNSSIRSFTKGYPTLKQKQKNASSFANSADLYFVNYPDGSDEQMQGCIFGIEYNGQLIGDKLSIVGQGITKGCHRTCTSDKCNGGVCYETYTKGSICDCSTAFGNGQYCTDGSRLVNKRYNQTFAKFVGLKLSWRSSGQILWEIGNKQSTLTMELDYLGQLVLIRKDLQRNSVDKKTALTKYIRNENFVLILRSDVTNSYKKINNVTVIYANYVALKAGDDNYDYMIQSSCECVMDVAVLPDEYDVQWNPVKFVEDSSSPYTCDDDNRQDLRLLGLLVIPLVAVALMTLIKPRFRFMWFGGRLKKINYPPTNGNVEEMENMNQSRVNDGVNDHLLYAPVNRDAPDENLNRLLREAAQNGDLYVKDYLDKGADVNAVDGDSGAPLHLAAKHGHLEIVHWLIFHGAAANKRDKSGLTPLHFAAANGHLDVVKFLISKLKWMKEGISTPAGIFGTPLHRAAVCGHLNVVKYLIDKGADVNAVDDKNQIPLHLCAENGYLDVVRYLIDKGADVNAVDNNNKTALHLAHKEDHLDVVKYLSQKVSDVNAVDDNKQDYVHLPTANSNFNVFKCLIKKGSDVNDEDDVCI